MILNLAGVDSILNVMSSPILMSDGLSLISSGSREISSVKFLSRKSLVMAFSASRFLYGFLDWPHSASLNLFWDDSFVSLLLPNMILFLFASWKLHSSSLLFFSPSSICIARNFASSFSFLFNNLRYRSYNSSFDTSLIPTAFFMLILYQKSPNKSSFSAYFNTSFSTLFPMASRRFRAS